MNTSRGFVREFGRRIIARCWGRAGLDWAGLWCTGGPMTRGGEEQGGCKLDEGDTSLLVLVLVLVLLPWTV